MSDTEKGVLIFGGVALGLFLLTRHNAGTPPPGSLYPSPSQTYNQDQVAANFAANAMAQFMPNQQMISQIFGSSGVGGGFGFSGEDY